MRAITILTRCRNAEGDLRRIQQRIDRRREAAEGMTPRMDKGGGMRGTSEPDRFSAMMADIGEIEAELEERGQAHSIEVAAVCVLLDSLPESEGAVLHQSYIKRQPIRAIAHKMRYSESNIRRLRADGESLVKAIPEESVVAALPTWYLKRWPDTEKKK